MKMNLSTFSNSQLTLSELMLIPKTQALIDDCIFRQEDFSLAQ